ncbi:MAG: dienelactone hydrolase family protein [Bacteroidetes bacterium]|nr:dienelactone hydrolase family protein [Bacteroidota bacterium]
MTTLVEKETLKIHIDGVDVMADLCLPKNAQGIIIFSHGSGSSRLSPRNQFVAEMLNDAGFATLLFDLLTDKEASVFENRFNIDLLTKRLISVTDWVIRDQINDDLPIGYFGASTGAASALRAAAVFCNKIKVVVSRGGRPDLAMSELSLVTAPIQLIVGSEDHQVIELNKRAFGKIHSPKEFVIIKGATHLFEELGKLEEVAENATRWFDKHLVATENMKDVQR